MRCPYCDFENDDDARECSFCNKSFDRDAKGRANGKNIWPWLVLGLAGVILVAMIISAGGGSGPGGGSGSSGADSTSTPSADGERATGPTLGKASGAEKRRAIAASLPIVKKEYPELVGVQPTVGAWDGSDGRYLSVTYVGDTSKNGVTNQIMIIVDPRGKTSVSASN